MSRFHTPGPWTDHSGDESQWGVFTSDGRCVAQAQQVHPLPHDRTQTERTANARLLSKAPEMLALLLARLADLEFAGGDDELTTEELLWREKTLALIRDLKERR
jgi:hypothetical protein